MLAQMVSARQLDQGKLSSFRNQTRCKSSAWRGVLHYSEETHFGVAKLKLDHTETGAVYAKSAHA
jgi:hypothetical protein